LAVFNISNLHSGYRKTVIENLSLQTDLPGLLVILGKNGSGKSTLLKCIAQQQEYSGNIYLDGDELGAFSIRDRSRIISYLHQKNSISLSIKVRDLVVMGRYRFKNLFSAYDENDYIEVDKWLERLGVLHLKDKYITELSGGEQQLIWICQALIQDTPMLILDEPSSQLDLMNKRKIFDLINVEVENKLVILVTHDIEYLKSLKGKMINLTEDGIPVREITPEEVDSQRQLLESA
jgi:iron complex transport system ATP-binding protein